MSRKFCIYCSFDCPRRTLDSSTIYNYLLLNGLKSTNNLSESDLIIVYTCGGFNTTELRSKKTIQHIKKKAKNNSKIIITGCLLNINPKSLISINDVIFLNSKELYKLDEIIRAKIKFKEIDDANKIADLNDLLKEPIGKKAFEKFSFKSNIIKKSISYIINRLNKKKHTIFSQKSYNIKVAHGCMGNCTYCAIRFSTGKLNSKPIEHIKQEFDKGIKKGYKDFVLIAEDIGCYGQDIGLNIVNLLEMLFSKTGDYRIILNDFNPKWLIKYFDQLLPILKNNKNRIQDLRIPVQSGSNRILKDMQRGYTIEQFYDCVERLKKNIPDLKIDTHIIVGFPGETDDDFEQTVNTINKINCNSVKFYIYEDRINTKAYYMNPKIPYKIKIRRLKRIYK